MDGEVIQFRCSGCNRLLALMATPDAIVEIKCTKCKAISLYCRGVTTPVGKPTREPFVVREPRI